MNPAAMSILLFLALAMFAGTISGRYWMLRAGEPDNRRRDVRRRLNNLLAIGFGQRRLLYEKAAGWMHAAIFAGFLVVAMRTVTLIGRGFAPEFHLPLLGGPLGLVYTFLKDTFAVIVIVAVLFAAYRRLVLRPGRLHLSGEALLILVWIGSLMVTDLLGDGAQFRLDPDSPERRVAWASTLLGGFFAGADPATVRTWAQVMYWAHVSLVLAFLNILPFGKHFHVLTALPAVFLGRLTPSAALDKMEFEGREIFGVGRLEDFCWRRILDMYTCTECGRCNDMCPTHVTGKPLSPREIIVHERDQAYALSRTPGNRRQAQGPGPGQGSRGPGGREAAAGFDRRGQRGRSDLGLHHLRLVRQQLPGDDRPHPEHHRPASLPDDDGGEGSRRRCRTP